MTTNTATTPAVTVTHHTHAGGFYFATIQLPDNRGRWSAPGGTAAQATLSAWDSYTYQRADFAAAFATLFPRVRA